MTALAARMQFCEGGLKTGFLGYQKSRQVEGVVFHILYL
jgi:hypothetical protein